MAIVKDFGGYMLADSTRHLQFGQSWWPYDTKVYVCPTLEQAKKILFEDLDKTHIEPERPLTVIYRVFAPKINVVRGPDGYFWTNQATKLHAGDVVYTYTQPEISNEALLENAANIMTTFSKKFLSKTK